MAFIPVFGKKKSTKHSQSSFGAALADLNKSNAESAGSPFALPKDPKHTSGAKKATSKTTPRKSSSNTANPSSRTAKHTRPRTPEVNPPQPVESSPEDAAAEHAGSDMEEPQQRALEAPVEDDGQRPVDATTSPEPKRGKENGRAEGANARGPGPGTSNKKTTGIKGVMAKRDHVERGPWTRAITGQTTKPKGKKSASGAGHRDSRDSSPARDPSAPPRRASTFGNEPPSPPSQPHRVSTDPSKPRRNPLAFNLLTGKHSKNIERRY